MGHGLTKTDKMVSGKGILPWHFADTGSDGRTLIKPGTMNVMEALESIGCANIDVRTEKVSHIILSDGRKLEAPEFRGHDGIVTPSYVIIQNGRPLAFCGERQQPLSLEKTFMPVQEIIDKAHSPVTTAGSLFDRRKFFMVFELPEVKTDKIGGEQYRKYLVVLTSQDGSMSIRYIWSMVRVVCANTYSAALYEGLAARRAARENNQNPNQVMRTIKHTKGAEERIYSALEQLQVGQKFFKAFKAQADALLEKAFPNKEWENLKNTLLPIAKQDDGEITKRAQTRGENRREELQTEYDSPDLANIKGTAWGALQAVVAYDQHVRTTRETNKTKPEENRFLRAVEGSDMVAKATEILNEYAGWKVPVLK